MPNEVNYHDNIELAIPINDPFAITIHKARGLNCCYILGVLNNQINKGKKLRKSLQRNKKFRTTVLL